MDVISLFAGLVAGVALGVVVGLLVARNREAAAKADLAAERRGADERVRAAEERVAAAERAASAKVAWVERSAQEKADLVEGQLAERIQAVATAALDANGRRFLELAEGRLQAANVKAAGELETRRVAVENLVGPLKETLARVENQLRESDAARRESQAQLVQHVEQVRAGSDQLREQTQALVTALRRPEARGRWGELQLRRVVELAGMTARCDFDEQVGVATADGTQRPDLVIRLAGGKNIVVDSKVSLAAYLEAAETSDPAVRSERMAAHARHLKDHVDRLAAKSYWASLSPAPEFVVLFIPGEAFLAPALEQDPGLLEHAMVKRVHIATPTTLVTMLRTAHYAWQQQALSENAKLVFDLGRELYDRLAGMGRHVDRLGRSLTNAVSTYNDTVGSLERRVLVSARKLNQLGVVNTELEEPRPVEEAPRALSAAELVTDSGSTIPELVADSSSAETRERRQAG
jgi:DNA recombination protein RmuC